MRSQTLADDSDSAYQQVATNSVFDFLYHDAGRVDLFLAQFNAHGPQRSVKRQVTEGSAAAHNTALTATGSIPLIASAALRAEGGSQQHQTEADERTYDPFWGNALAFLDLLHQRSLIKHGPADATVGQFVLVSGALSIIDMSLLGTILKMPSARDLLKAPLAQPGLFQEGQHQNRQDRRRNEKGAGRLTDGSTAANEQALDLFFDFVKLAPYAVRAAIATDDEYVIWSTVQAESLVVHTADLMLEHGTILAGRWSMLGILDAYPDSLADASTTPGQSRLKGLLAASLIQKAVDTVRILSALGLSRPADAFGVTPLLIFREVEER